MLLNLSQYFLAHPTLTLCNSFCWALCAPQPGLCVLHWNQRWFNGVRGTPEAEPCQWLRLTHTCSSVIQVLNRHPCSAVLSNNRVPLNMYVCLLFFYSRNCPGKAIQLRCMGKQFAPGGIKLSNDHFIKSWQDGNTENPSWKLHLAILEHVNQQTICQEPQAEVNHMEFVYTYQ